MSKDNKLTLEDIGSFFEKLAEKSDIVYWLSSPDFSKIQYISAAYEKIWMRSREALYKNPELWISYLHPDDTSGYHPIHAMAERIVIEGSAARYDETYRITRPNGEIRWIIDRGFPIYDSHGKCCGVTGVAVDITERKYIEENFQKVEHQLKGMTMVTATIAHELRTPLAAIKAAAKGIKYTVSHLITAYKNAVQQQIQDETIPGSRIKSLEGALNSIESKVDQSNMVIDMLLSNIKNRDVEISGLEICSAKECIQKAISQYTFVSPKPEIDLKDNKDFAFRGKEMLILHIFFNLLKNAIYFIQKVRKGKIIIWIDMGKNTNEIHFKDTAAGIPEEHLPKIFDDFFTFETNKGSGIGLSFCKRTMQAIGGDIVCRSVYGEYTEFILSFPPLSEN